MRLFQKNSLQRTTADSCYRLLIITLQKRRLTQETVGRVDERRRAAAQREQGVPLENKCLIIKTNPTRKTRLQKFPKPDLIRLFFCVEIDTGLFFF